MPVQRRVVPGSAAARWRILRVFVVRERRLALWAARRPATTFAYEFTRFGLKQGWACLFGGVMLALLLGTHRWYPAGAALSRYDFLTLSAVAVQAVMLLAGMETREEAKVILLFHLAGTVMEVFKTAVGSWVYPEPGLLRLGGVPLFTGFMYASVGSYMARAWRLFDFRFSRHPGGWAVLALALAIYINFFTDHVGLDVRMALFAADGLLFARTVIHYRIWRVHRRMPFLLAQLLATMFVWLAENIGTFTHAWLYPFQIRAWTPLGFGKLGSWFLLMLLSYALVASVQGVRSLRAPVSRPARTPGWTAGVRAEPP